MRCNSTKHLRYIWYWPWRITTNDKSKEILSFVMILAEQFVYCVLLVWLISSIEGCYFFEATSFKQMIGTSTICITFMADQWQWSVIIIWTDQSQENNWQVHNLYTMYCLNRWSVTLNIFVNLKRPVSHRFLARPQSVKVTFTIEAFF